MTTTTSKRVLFMSAKTPGNFPGTRDRQEVRTLALRAASFARPNRRKKNRRTACDEVQSASDHAGQRCADQAWSDPTASSIIPLDPSSVVGNGKSDPFDSMPVPVTADSHDILTYTRSFTYAINWPDELGACREGGSLYLAHQVLYRKYFEHAAPLNGLLSYVYNLMAIAQPEKADVHRQKSMQYSVRCFKCLRGLIGNLDYSYDQLLLILQTIWPLASAEYSESVRTGDDSCFQHRCALKRLIQLLGGLNRLPLVYRELFVHFFAKIAVVTGTCTEIDPSSWDPGPWNAQSMTSTPRQIDGIRSPLSRQTDILGSTLSDILAGLRELVAVEEVKRQGTWSDEDHLSPIFRWSFLRRIALKMRLWNLWHSSADQLNTQPSPNTPGSSLDSSLCLAAQLFIYLSLEAHPIKQPWFAIPTQHAEMLERIKAMDTVLLQRVKDLDLAAKMEDPLLDAVANNNPSALAQAQDLLWIVAIGACFEEEVRKQQGRNQILDLTVMPEAAAAARAQGQEPENLSAGNAAGTTPPTEWFSMRFGILARRLGYPRFEHVRGSFRREYVYDGTMMDETLERLFDMEM
ncbi:uncharacterized protein A1O5_11204 [Cladophialophora psammophila CBS 110553]|uniref:Transcription factor domain-containing protein n=1 Tax=Cladophialophora psammophila CBS 110553 TaxID=1182543 RepID=W9WC42_9EURO|nr:uncharacterized protein A1O5_11204 [Cladophialophora psammophila CBS 110553]EXJ65677.1 hypothetical protein A1O5_11204 [Cladophialophora psammophila CBS 110553]